MHTCPLARALALALCLSPVASLAAAPIGTSGIADGAVTTPKLANGAVTAAKMANGAVGAAQLAAGAVGSSALAAGAVTDAKIAGPISASKIQGGVFQQKYAQVVTVAKAGGDFTDPIVAMASIVAASAATPFLLRIMPGVYDLGATPLTLKPYVDVEGSGKGVTVLSGRVPSLSGNLNWGPGLVNAANHAEIRHLTVSNASVGPGYTVGIHAESLDDVAGKVPSSFSIEDVEVRVDGGGSVSTTYASPIGVTANFSTIRVRRASIQAGHSLGGGFGMVVSAGNADVKDAEIRVRAEPDGGAFGVFFVSWANLTAPGMNRLEDVRIDVESANYRAYGVIAGGVNPAAFPIVLKDLAIRTSAPESAPFDNNGAAGTYRCAANYDNLLQPLACPP